MKTFQFYLKTFIDYGLCVYLMLILAVMPFYNREGYSHIGSDKAYFFDNIISKTGWILLPAVLVYLALIAVSLRKKFFDEIRQKINLTDLFAGGYGLILVISYLCSEYKENALWGTTGWYMGFCPQMALVLTYFFVSKCWKPRRWMIYMTLVSSGVVFLLGYLNRMRVDPLDMGVDNASFISTIGNINWYCGYLVSVFFAGVILLWQGKDLKRWKQALLMLYVLIGYGSLLTQGSDSGFAALAVVMLTMFVLSANHSTAMLMFWLEVLLLCGAGMITYTIQAIFPERLNYAEGIGIWMVSKGIFFYVTIISVLAIVLLYRSIKADAYPQKVFLILSRIVMAVVPVAIVLVITLIVVNTLKPGSLGSLSESPFFTFSLKWGSGRGATWIAGWMCFAEQGFWHKLIGVGPDNMSAYLYAGGSEELRVLVQQSFGGLILSNAHNEWLTVLVNTGIFGLVAFGGMFITGIWRFLKETGHNEIVCACGFCLLAYTANNMFSFQQSMNVATIFAVFGMGGAFVLQPKVSVDLKTGSGKHRKAANRRKRKK